MHYCLYIVLSILLLDVILYLVGMVARRCLGIKAGPLTAYNLFFNVLTGSFVLATLCAIICTKCKGTVLWAGVLPTVLFLQFCKDKHDVSRTSLTISQLAIISLFIFGYACAFFLIIYDKGMLIVNDGDFRCWAVLTSSLRDGFENYAGFSNYMTNIPLEPYHWIELWLAIPIIYILRVPYQLACDCVVFPVLLNLVFWGLLALDDELGRSAWRTVFVMLLPHLAIVTLYIFVLNILGLQITHAGHDFWYRWILAKDALPLCLILTAIIMLKSGRLHLAATSLLYVICCDVSWWPSLLFSAGCLMILYAFPLKTIHMRAWPLVGFVMVTGVLLCFLAYLYVPALSNALNAEVAPASFSALGKHILECILLFIGCYSLFLFIHKGKALFVYDNYSLALFILFVSASIGGFIGFCLMHRNYDAAQFFKLYVLLNLCGWLLLLGLPQRLARTVFLILSLFSLLLHVRYFLRLQSFIPLEACQRSYMARYIQEAKHIENSIGKVVVGVFLSEVPEGRLSLLYPERGFRFPLGGYLHHVYYVSLTTLNASAEKAASTKKLPVSIADSKNISLLPSVNLIHVDAKVNLPEEIETNYLQVAEEPITGYRLFVRKW